MKKFLVLLLAAVMCFSLTACGSCGHEKYLPLINALEAEDYEEAINEVYELYLENGGEIDNGGDNTDDSADNTDTSDETSEPEPTAEALMWMELAPSEYLVYCYDEENEPLQNFTLNADGSCVIEGQNYTWAYEKNYEGAINCGKDYCYIDVMDGEEHIYNISLGMREEGYVSASLYVVVDEYSSNGVNGIFYRANDLMVIELDLENWADYFEAYEDITVERNSFDEPTSMYIKEYMLLKPEYGYVISDLSKVAIEYSRQEIRQMITTDPEAKTYTWGEVKYTWDRSDPSTSEMYSQWMEDDSRRYGFQTSYTNVHEFPEYEAYRYIDFEMTRLKGTIYCVPPKG